MWSRCTTDRQYRPARGDSSLIVVVSHGGVTVDFLRSSVGDAVVEAVAPGVLADGMPGGCITEVLFEGPLLSVARIADVSTFWTRIAAGMYAADSAVRRQTRNGSMISTSAAEEQASLSMPFRTRLGWLSGCDGTSSPIHRVRGGSRASR